MDHAGITTFSIRRFFTKLVLFGYGYFLLFLFRGDMIRQYIHERYQIITVTASVVLIAASVAYSSLSRRDGRDGESATPGYLFPGASFIVAAAFLVAPVIWGLLTPPETLGASKERMSNRFTFSSSSISVDPEILRTPGPRDKKVEYTAPDGSTEIIIYTPLNIMELNYILSSAGDSLVGNRIIIQGFVYHEDVNTENEFTLVRYQVPCCILHAHPASVFVRGAQASLLATDQWVVVHGVIKKMSAQDADRHSETDTQHDGDKHEEEHLHMPFYIEAESIKLENTPRDPYINRWFLKKPFQF